MKRSLKLCSSLIIFCFSLQGYVGSVEPGQSLWCIDKRIANTSDIIESKVCIIESLVENLSTSTVSCSPTVVTAADIVMGVITLSASGNYCLAQDVTADIMITGDCISFDLNNRCVTGVVTITSDDVEIFNGNIKPPAPSSAPSASMIVATTSARSTLSNLIIENANSAGTGIDGRIGVEIYGDDIQFLNSTVIAGSGSDGATGGVGGIGLIVGNGVTVANNVIVTNCLFASGNGGNSTGSGIDGADGGAAILIKDLATEAEIIGCTVLSTGFGGDGTVGNADGGNGGDGVFVESGAIDTVVRGCTIRNTGTGGSGNGTGVAGAGGKAAQDNVTIVANLSMFYQNFAHNIDNTIKYALQGMVTEQGVAIANPPTATVVNPYANVFVS